MTAFRSVFRTLVLAGLLGCAPAVAQLYTLVDLGTLGLPNSEAMGINSEGDVVGFAYVGYPSHAWDRSAYNAIGAKGFVYSQGQQRDLHDAVGKRLRLCSEPGTSAAVAINNSGDVAGAYWCRVRSGGSIQGFIYRDGFVTPMAVVPATRSEFRVGAISASGEVLGENGGRAYRYRDGTYSDIATFGDKSSANEIMAASGDKKPIWVAIAGRSSANAINEQGQIVGFAISSSGTYHAVLWTGDSVKDLGTLGGYLGWATGINATGQVVGFSLTGSHSIWRQGETHAFLYTDGAMKDLGALSGCYSVARGINAAGHIVGASSIRKCASSPVYVPPTHAFLFQDGAMKDLNSLLTAPLATVELTSAVAINDSGWIAANGDTQDNVGSLHKKAYLLIPAQVSVPAR